MKLFKFFLIILIISLLIAGCSDDNEHIDTGFIPVGEWIDQFDSYTITKDFVDYLMFDMVLKGSIEKAVDFTNNSGVLIIKITEATYHTTGKYTGIYYTDYTNTTIKMATAFAEGNVEADTLTAAMNLFTVDNAGTHVNYWGTYTK